MTRGKELWKGIKLRESAGMIRRLRGHGWRRGCEQMGAWRSFAASRCAYQDGGCAWMPNRRSHRSKPGISRLFSFDYRFDYNKKSKTAYGRPNGLHLPRMKDWGCAEIEQNGKRKIKNI